MTRAPCTTHLPVVGAVYSTIVGYLILSFTKSIIYKNLIQWSIMAVDNLSLKYENMKDEPSLPRPAPELARVHKKQGISKGCWRSFSERGVHIRRYFIFVSLIYLVYVCLLGLSWGVDILSSLQWQELLHFLPLSISDSGTIISRMLRSFYFKRQD